MMNNPRCNVIINNSLFFDPSIERDITINYHKNRMILCIVLSVIFTIIFISVLLFSHSEILNIVAIGFYVIAIIYLIYLFIVSSSIKKINISLPVSKPYRPCISSDGLLQKD